MKAKQWMDWDVQADVEASPVLSGQSSRLNEVRAWDGHWTSGWAIGGGIGLET